MIIHHYCFWLINDNQLFRFKPKTITDLDLKFETYTYISFLLNWVHNHEPSVKKVVQVAVQAM